MSKNRFFTGQPIFSQLLNFIPSHSVSRIAKQFQSDRYTKKFTTYNHLVTMLFVAFKRCTSLREVTLGMSVCHHKLSHLGIDYVPARSTLSEANSKRPSQVFEAIFYEVKKALYPSVSPDSRGKSIHKRLYIIDSTTISLFQEILKGAGRNPLEGKRKGGIKVHTLIRSEDDVPMFVKLSAAANHDSTFLKQIHLPKGSILAFDKGYKDYGQYERLTQSGITFVTRLNEVAYYQTVKEKPVSPKDESAGVLKDENVVLGRSQNRKTPIIKARLVHFKDPDTGKVFVFLTNNYRLSALNLALIYQKRWQIELLFKRIKQNYPIQYFLGDNPNAIQIQVWCALIADLILRKIKQTAKKAWFYSGIASLIQQHLMEYISLSGYLRAPDQIIQILRHLKTKEPPENLFSIGQLNLFK